MENFNDSINIYEYQNELLEIYKYTKIIFDKYKIKMVAHSGTLLGIIRHNNDFIPWDDDLDILVSYRDIEKNFSSIEEEINTENGEYWIFNFINNNSNINANIFTLRVYKRTKVNVNFSEEFASPFPFIDIMVMVPSDSFRTNFGWIRYSWRHQMYWMTRRGFKRFQGSQNRKFKCFRKNLITYPLKIFFRPDFEENKIRKILDNRKGDWSKLRRTDSWSRRNITYNMDKIKISNLRGAEIYINEDYENELVKSFGVNWKREIETHSHVSSQKHNFHSRNMEIKKFLEELKNVKKY